MPRLDFNGLFNVDTYTEGSFQAGSKIFPPVDSLTFYFHGREVRSLPLATAMSTMAVQFIILLVAVLLLHTTEGNY